MNTDTGELKSYTGDEMNDLRERNLLSGNPWIEISEDDMTRKQKRKMQVSNKDHRSKLGKQLTKIQQRKKVFGR